MVAEDIKNVERGTFANMLKGECDDETKKLFDEYFSHFVVPEEEGKCLKCGTVQGGLMAALLGGFTYDLQHGEGHCSKCHWPARANHYFKDKDGKAIGSMRMILQYHPDFVTKPATVSDKEWPSEEGNLDHQA
jgi:hypothetical protein